MGCCQGNALAPGSGIAAGLAVVSYRAEEVGISVSVCVYTTRIHKHM